MKTYLIVVLIFLNHSTTFACMSCFFPQDDKLSSGGVMPPLFGNESGLSDAEKIEQGLMSNESSFRPRQNSVPEAVANSELQDAIILSNQLLYAEDGNSYRDPFEHNQGRVVK